MVRPLRDRFFGHRGSAHRALARRRWLGAPEPSPVAREAEFQLVLSGSCSAATLSSSSMRQIRAMRSSASARTTARTGPWTSSRSQRRHSRHCNEARMLPCSRPWARPTARTPTCQLAWVMRWPRWLRDPDAVPTTSLGGRRRGHLRTRRDAAGHRCAAIHCPDRPGAPLCRAKSGDERIDGLEIALKGGQVGGPEYLEQVRKGHP